MCVPPWYRQLSTFCVEGELFHVVETLASAWIGSIHDDATFHELEPGTRKALVVDPGCIETHLILAKTTPDGRLRHAHLSKAVETGRRLWQSVFRREPERCWLSVTAIRPYKRTIDSLAVCCADCGDWTEALRLRRKLLRMNSIDDQGIRLRMGLSTQEIEENHHAQAGENE